MCVWSVTQLCLTLCIPMDCSPPGTYVRGTFQGRMLEQVAHSYARESSRLRDWTYIACVSCIGTTVPPGKPTLFIGDLYTDLVAESCPTLYDPMGCSPPGSSVHVIFQGRILEWVVTSFSRGFSPPTNWTWGSWNAGRFFTNWDTREVHWCIYYIYSFIHIHVLKCF